jgi:hypothetical protein
MRQVVKIGAPTWLFLTRFWPVILPRYGLRPKHSTFAAGPEACRNGKARSDRAPLYTTFLGRDISFCRRRPYRRRSNGAGARTGFKGHMNKCAGRETVADRGEYSRFFFFDDDSNEDFSPQPIFASGPTHSTQRNTRRAFLFRKGRRQPGCFPANTGDDSAWSCNAHDGEPMKALDRHSRATGLLASLSSSLFTARVTLFRQ